MRFFTDQNDPQSKVKDDKQRAYCFIGANNRQFKLRWGIWGFVLLPKRTPSGHRTLLQGLRAARAGEAFSSRFEVGPRTSNKPTALSATQGLCYLKASSSMIFKLCFFRVCWDWQNLLEKPTRWMCYTMITVII